MMHIESLLRTTGVPLRRRHFLAGVAGLAGAAALPRRLWAQAAPHTFEHGEFEVTVLSDGHLVLPAGIFAADAPPEERKALFEALGFGEEVKAAANPVLLRKADDLILIDTGSGANFQPTAGKLEENLAAAGVKASDITKVVMTHGHPDHMWGNALDNGALRYPNATYYSGAAEWDFWNGPDIFTQMPKDMHPFVEGAQKHYMAAKDRVTMLKPGDDIVTGLRALDTSGHTPGHMSFEVAGGEGLIIVADAIGIPAIYFPHPDWKLGFDAIHEKAIAVRQAMLDRAATDKTKMLGFHWPYPGVGFAERKDNAYQYVPAA
jgi:glyoxylase-like metal-dependent hydrolase (beta-lactamase superfamily II)